MTDIRNLPLVEISLSELAGMIEAEASETIRKDGVTRDALAQLRGAAIMRDAEADSLEAEGSA